jgi:mediator of RNA polymerase II transcription subunit 13
MVPASAVSDAALSEPNRRTSNFKPIAFNENLDLASKYANRKHVDFAKDISNNSIPSIALPQKRRKSRSKRTHDPDSGVTDLDSSSEDDSYESTTSMSDEENLPPQLPWDTKKRKRSSWHELATPVASEAEGLWPMDDVRDSGVNKRDSDNLSDVLVSLLHHSVSVNAITSCARISSSNDNSELTTLPSIEYMFEFRKIDLIYVAQILSEQAVSSIPGMLQAMAVDSPLEGDSAISSALEAIIESTVEKLLSTVDDCSISKLALVKEPPQRPIMNPGKAPQTSQPRPLQREGSMQLGPDYFPIQPPFVRVQRGSDTWEMLPPALSFWSALGLGPVSGPKDVTPIALVPGNSDLVGLVQDFVRELGGVYEGRKLGSFARSPEIHDWLTATDSYDDGCVSVGVDEDALSVAGALKAVAEVCEDLGRTLADIGHVDPDRTIVVLIIDPFENEPLQPYLAACFWKLCKAYRQYIPKAHAKSPRSDVVLQLLPVSLVAAPDQLVVLDTQHLGSLAMEVYDRCPPSSKAMVAMDTASALPIPAAPAIELASLPPKRIAFQLVPDPPSDLMHEGSVMHLAYALSTDMQWMAANWTDSTGRYQMATSTSLRGKTFQDVAAEIWERTLDILTARDVTWRIFVVAGAEIDASEASCWRSLAASKPRRQMLHVTLLSIETETSLQLSAPSASDNSTAAGTSGQSGQFLTPGSTPQGTAMTVSPDASGQAAPPTPAPTDATPSNPENDPDAHLVDVTDESWAMLLAPSFTSSISHRAEDATSPRAAAMAKGVLFRRGNLSQHASSDKLESLGVSLHWDIRMRPNGAVDEGPVRQAEVTLREVLRMYRNLGLLGRARNVNGASGPVVRAAGGERMVPVHLAAATRAAEALSWFRI